MAYEHPLPSRFSRPSVRAVNATRGRSDGRMVAQSDPKRVGRPERVPGSLVKVGTTARPSYQDYVPERPLVRALTMFEFEALADGPRNALEKLLKCLGDIRFSL